MKPARAIAGATSMEGPLARATHESRVSGRGSVTARWAAGIACVEVTHDRWPRKRSYLRLELGEAKRLRDELAAVIAEREPDVAEAAAEAELADTREALRAAEQRLADYEQALEPFADQYNWHHNYDGTGIIFKPSGCYSDESIEPFIELARAALARHGRDEAPAHERGTREEQQP